MITEVTATNQCNCREPGLQPFPSEGVPAVNGGPKQLRGKPHERGWNSLLSLTLHHCLISLPTTIPEFPPHLRCVQICES